jgi:hypothetical protein
MNYWYQEEKSHALGCLCHQRYVHTCIYCMTLQTLDKDVNYCVHRRQALDTGMYMRNIVMKSGCVLEQRNKPTSYCTYTLWLYNGFYLWQSLYRSVFYSRVIARL